MKTIYFIFTTLFVLSTFYMRAQTDKGSILIGGKSDFNFGSTSEQAIYDGKDAGSELSIFNFNFAPYGGIFIIDNLAIGAALPFSYISMEDDNSTFSRRNIGLTPFGRYYFGTGSLKPFGQISFGISSEADESTQNNSTNKSDNSSLLFGISAGAAFFVNDAVAIEGILGYTRESITDGSDSKSKYTISNFGLGIGISVYLSK